MSTGLNIHRTSDPAPQPRGRILPMAPHDAARFYGPKIRNAPLASLTHGLRAALAQLGGRLGR